MAQSNERPERDETDDSLAGERAKSDAALSEMAAVEEAADDIVERARVDADDTLTLARAEADAKLESTTHRAQTRAAIEDERASEDAAIETSRARADAALRRERAVNAELLAQLIPLERDKTDQFLLTERARADDAVANRDGFLGIVSHDLRSLLSGISLSAEIITAQCGQDERGNVTRLAAERIKRGTVQMARLINDLLDVSSIEAGKLTIFPESVDGGELIVQALELWRGPAGLKSIRLEATTANAVQVQVDRERVLQVLGNLLTNAVKFSPSGTTVSIGMERVGRVARISVKDSGCGIPHDNQKAIFDRFWQVDPDERGGLGLGLYIASSIVEAHGGAIWVESTEGAGSKFFFTVPCAP